MLEGKKILFVSEKSGFCSSVERYIYQTANFLKTHGAQVYGAFFEKAPGAQLFQSVFDEIYSPDKLPASEIDLVCIHKIPSLAYHQKLQSDFKEKAALFIHDHDYYCPRSSKTMPLLGKECDRSYQKGFCSFCGMMRAPASWKGSLASEINQKVVLFQDRLDIMRRYQHTVVLSCFMRDNLLTNGFSPSFLHVIPPYIYIPRQLPPHRQPPPPIILYIGRPDDCENGKIFLKVLSKVRHRFQAYIIGDGHGKSILERLAKKMQLDDKVVFKGMTKQEDYFMLADMALIPLSAKEPYSLEVAECAAWGLPIISSKSRGLAEVLQNGVNGFTASCQDIKAMASDVERLLSAPELRREFGENSYNLIKRNFAEEEIIRKFSKLLETTIK